MQPVQNISGSVFGTKPRQINRIRTFKIQDSDVQKSLSNTLNDKNCKKKDNFEFFVSFIILLVIA